MPGYRFISKALNMLWFETEIDIHVFDKQPLSAVFHFRFYLFNVTMVLVSMKLMMKMMLMWMTMI